MTSEAQVPARLDEGKIRVALGDADTPGLVLYIIALHWFGPAVLGDPEEGVAQIDAAEMWAGLHGKYGTWVTEEGENRLNAIITGLEEGMFWRDLNTFMAVSTALFDGDMGDLITTGFEDLSATEMMWAMLEMELAWDSDETPEFSLDVVEFIEQTLMIEQENQEGNTREVENSYLVMLDQLREMGIPTSMIRVWDEEYSEVMEELADGEIG